MKKHIPNTITCCNLISGCIATYFAFQGDFRMALLFIVIGAVFDFFDGMVARLLHVSSPIGKELDSLADDITFGFAPSAIVFSYLCTFHIHIPVVPFLAFVMAAFSALRLAKFNLDERQALGFIGLPTPANALFWGALIVGLQEKAICFEGMEWCVLVGTFISCWLPIAEIPKMEFAALHDGDVKAAIRLSCHYGIYLNKPYIGEVWRFRAAQLGNINATRSLSERGLLDGGRRSYFLKATESTAFAELSGIAQRYILFHAKDRRKNNVSSDGSTDFTIRNLDVEPAIVRTGSVNAMFCRDSSVLSWPMGYIAYKTRCGESLSLKKAISEIVVFPSFDGVCQKAVDVAEERSLPWIVVAIDIEDHFRCRPKEVSLEECCRCTCKVLELVFADFSLPRSTIVRFAESVTFARQMEPMTKGSFMVMQAPSYLMCRR